MLRALVAAGVFSLLAVAGAFGVPAPHPPSSPAGSVVRNAARTWSESEIIQIVEGGTVRKAISWGARIGYFGALVGAASLIDFGLNWFYEQAKKSTASSLDDWYNWADTGVVIKWVSSGYSCTYPDHNVLVAYRYFRANGDELSGTISSDVPCSSASAKAQVEELLYSRYGRGLSGSWGACSGSFDDCFSAYENRPSLADWLQSHPDAMDAMRNQVLPGYSDHETGDPNTYPYTFSQPFPGVSLDQSPNGNQWWDDPYYSPTTDTDGDGWPDWMEERLGAKPGNAGNYPDPSADPDGDGYTNDQERNAGTDPADPNSHPNGNGDPTTDTDGDGIADSADPCPTDPTNSCSYSDPSQEDKPDWSALNQESTQQQVLTTLQQIQENTKPKDDNETVTPPDYSGEQPDLPEWSPAAPLESAWTSVTMHFTDTLTGLEMSMEDKLPFALGSWIPVLSAGTGTPACAEIPITLLGIQTSLGWCDSPFYAFLSTTVRAGLLVLLLIGFYFASARTLAWS